MAMGASASDVVRLVMTRGVRLTLLGLALGLAGSVAVARLLRSHLFGVIPLDPVTFGSVVLLLTGRGPRGVVPAGSSRDPRGAERGPPPELRPRPGHRLAVMSSAPS